MIFKFFKRKRKIIAISAVPAGQCSGALNIGESEEKVNIGNTPGVFCLMSDSTIELYLTQRNKWTKLPAIPGRHLDE